MLLTAKVKETGRRKKGKKRTGCGSVISPGVEVRGSFPPAAPRGSQEALAIASSPRESRIGGFDSSRR